jgi:D-3-phosphoglycerate dehydrogenase
MSWKVMVSAPYMQPILDRFKALFEKHDIQVVVPPVNERLGEEELLEWIGDIDGVICGDDKFTDRVLRAAPRLKVISKWGTGIDSIDVDACGRRGIAVRNTPNAFTVPVSESVMGYILCFARRLVHMDRDMRAGRWCKKPGVSLSESTLGVIGVGNIGKAVVRRATGFGMRTLGNDLVDMPKEFLAETGVQMVSLDNLLTQADFVSLNCDLNSTSYHLLDERAFELMKPTAYVINTSRGPIVEERALIKALKEKRIAGAALDVFEFEPLPVNSQLRRMKNVLLAPHSANSSPEAWERVHRNTIDNLLEVLTNSAK